MLCISGVARNFDCRGGLYLRVWGLVQSPGMEPGG